jgi:hypothetical protein
MSYNIWRFYKSQSYSQPYGSTTLSGHLIRVKLIIGYMSFQRRHFEKLAKIAADMELTPEQQYVLIAHLKTTNSRFDGDRFYDWIRKEEIENEESNKRSI